MVAGAAGKSLNSSEPRGLMGVTEKIIKTLCAPMASRDAGRRQQMGTFYESQTPAHTAVPSTSIAQTDRNTGISDVEGSMVEPPKLGVAYEGGHTAWTPKS